MEVIAARTAETAPVLLDMPEPASPAAGQVLCETLQLGVCGTDREILETGTPHVPAGENFLALGHECLGRALEVGAEVEGFEPGDLVVPVVRRNLETPEVQGDSRLQQRIARPDLMPWGTYTERGIVEEHGFSQPRWLDRPEFLFPVPPEIADVAVLTEPFTVTEKGINEAELIQSARFGLPAWQQHSPRVLVTGMGPIGFAGVLGCVARGWPVTMYGRDAEDTFRVELTRELGAKYISQEEMQWDSLDLENEGFDLVLECTGSDHVMMNAGRTLRSCGIMVWLGSSRLPEASPHNVGAWMRDGLLSNHICIGSVNAASRDFSRALDYLVQLHREKGATLSRMITERLEPAESLWHYQHREPQGIKTVLMYAA